jgi:tetratricopeptide (TPR) repeat protein
VATDAWIRLVWVVGVDQGRPEDGHRWAQFAEAALQRLGHDPLREAMLSHNRAGIYYMERRKELALEGYKRALEVQTELLGEDDPAVARTLNHIGNTLIISNRLEEARSYCARSLAMRERTLGDRHPLVAASLNNLAAIQQGEGNAAGALELAERSLAIVRGSGTPEERIALWIAADALRGLGRDEEAELRIERAKAIAARPGENSL